MIKLSSYRAFAAGLAFSPGSDDCRCNRLRIPTQGGQVFQSDRGHHSNLIAATPPI
jgi:hypothetical protein